MITDSVSSAMRNYSFFSILSIFLAFYGSAYLNVVSFGNYITKDRKSLLNHLAVSEAKDKNSTIILCILSQYDVFSKCVIFVK